MSAPTQSKPGGKKKGQVEEPTFQLEGPAPSPTLTPPIPTPPVITPSQNPQLTPLARKNIVKVDPNLVRQAVREKSIIPAKQVTDSNVITLANKTEAVNNYVLFLTKDLKSGTFQYFGTPQNFEEFFEDSLIVIGDRFDALAKSVIMSKISEIEALARSGENYDEVAKKVAEVHEQMIILLSALERSILEVAGLATSKMRLEGLSPLEVAQTIGITPITTDRL